MCTSRRNKYMPLVEGKKHIFSFSEWHKCASRGSKSVRPRKVNLCLSRKKKKRKHVFLFFLRGKQICASMSGKIVPFVEAKNCICFLSGRHCASRRSKKICLFFVFQEAQLCH